MRLNQYDVLKGIAIILVLVGHAIPRSGVGRELIYGFHMPLFFFCSGCFFNERPFLESTKKDIKGLLIPWCTFSIVLVCCNFVLKYFGYGHTFNPLDENCYVLYQIIWFLICLFITRLLYRSLYMLRNKLIINTLIWGGYMMTYCLGHNNINIPFFIDTAFAMLAFYHIGYLFKSKGYQDYRSPIWANVLLLIVYAVFVWYVHPQVNIRVNIFPIYLVILSMVPIYALYQICCHIKSKFLTLCGVASLTIMGLHGPIYDIVMFPLMRRSPLPQSIEIVLTVVVTLGLTLIAHKLLMKYAPVLLGKF